METPEIGLLQEKLQAFYDQLDDEEKVVVAGVLLRAAGDPEVTGFTKATYTGPVAQAAPGVSVPAGSQLSIAMNPANPMAVVVIPL